MTDPGCVRAGFLEQAAEPLRAANVVDFVVFDRVAPSPGIAQALGEDTRGLSVWAAAERACEAVNRLSDAVGIPTMQAMGFSEDEIPMLARITFEDPQTVGNPRDLTEGAYVGIYGRAFGRA